MRRQPMDLGDPRVDALIADCEQGLQRLLGAADADIFMAAANGHGAWEMAVLNLLAPGQLALVPGSGHFSESWALQTEALGRRALRTPWVEGCAIDVAAVERALRADTGHEIAAVFAVQTDTASGITSDMAGLRAAIDAAGHPALFVVDVVASLAAAPFAMAAGGIDAAIGASQKGLMLPPGLAFVAARPRAVAAARANPGPRFYFDWGMRQSPLSYRKFCGTPPMAHLMGLQAALRLIELEGMDAVLARHRWLAGAVHAAVEAWAEGGDVKFHARDAATRSVSVTAIEVRPGIDVEALRTVARERFQVAMAGGLGVLAGRAFRIGHLGDLNPAMVLGALGGIEAAMAVQGIARGRDALGRAAQWLAHA
jgi:alanine-glyoxylate transaminase/serine-glyoxylate transaminase/serine-pyruvate transaminase